MRFMARRAAVEAIRSMTSYVVVDSGMVPIDQYAADEKVPVIMVFTDQAKSPLENTDFLTSATQTFIFEAAITQKNVVKDVDENGDPVEVEFWTRCESDAHTELELDLLCRDIQLGLNSPTSPWADFFKSLLKKTGKFEVYRGNSGPDQDRFAARQIVFEADLPKEPSRKQSLVDDTHWGRFIQLAETLEDGEFIIKKLKYALLDKTDPPLNDVQNLKEAYGLTETDSDNLLVEQAVFTEGPITHGGTS
jgi:hypothetical protein